MVKVGILMGSDSDLPIMQKAAQMLEKFGIEYGDYVLRGVAECIVDSVSEGQNVYRVVADEFMIPWIDETKCEIVFTPLPEPEEKESDDDDLWDDDFDDPE